MTQENDLRPSIHAMGDVVSIRKPDVAYLSLYVRAEGILLEDAVREATAKLDEVQRTLRDAYGGNIKDIRTTDVHMGDGKPAMGFAMRDKSTPPRPEVVKGILVVIPAKSELAVKVVDTACRMGCLMGNPTAPGAPNPASVILYGLADSTEAEQEAITLAIAEAREKASRIAETLKKTIGGVRTVGIMAFHGPEEFMRRNKTPLLSRGTYLSVRPDQVEIPGKVSITFELTD